tara:strand:+ start:181 stop:324 length:144 start_codon:yes stop_codon:yes gene_type:complete
MEIVVLICELIAGVEVASTSSGSQLVLEDEVLVIGVPGAFIWTGRRA